MQKLKHSEWPLWNSAGWRKWRTISPIINKRKLIHYAVAELVWQCSWNIQEKHFLNKVDYINQIIKNWESVPYCSGTSLSDCVKQPRMQWDPATSKGHKETAGNPGEAELGRQENPRKALTLSITECLCCFLYDSKYKKGNQDVGTRKIKSSNQY